MVGREKNEGLQTKQKLLTLHCRLIDCLSNPLSASSGIPSLIELSLGAGAFLTDADRFPIRAVRWESNA